VKNSGIDLGYSETKIACDLGTRSFPSVVGTADMSRFKAAGTDSTKTIKISDDGTWMYGYDAVMQSRVLQRREDRNWIFSKEYYRIFLAALSESTRESCDMSIVSGLPVTFYDDKDKLSEILLGEHAFVNSRGNKISVNIISAKVVPQPFGTILNEVFSDDGNIANAQFAALTVGVVDIGSKTTNLLSCTKLAENRAKTSGVSLGGWDAVRDLRTRFESRFPDLELRDHQIADCIKTGTVKYYGKALDIADEVSSVLSPIAETIASQMTTLWGAGAELDKILITGGGALLVGEYITSQFRHAEIVANPVYSNVEGYYKFSKSKFTG